MSNWYNVCDVAIKQTPSLSLSLSSIDFRSCTIVLTLEVLSLSPVYTVAWLYTQLPLHLVGPYTPTQSFQA